MRHPGYLGFLLFAVGTQLMLMNPICFVAFLVSVYQFMRDRIEYEDVLLSRWYGAEFDAYRDAVWSGIPRVK